jgi:RNA polymerase sigma-70 factor (ECF subfamily)
VADDSRARQAEFEETAVPHMDHVYNAAMYLARDPDTAADLLQETFLRAYRAWHQFAPGTNCKAWLMTILHNAFRNRYRAARAAAATVELDEEVHSSAGDPARSAVPDDPAERALQDAFDDEIEAALRDLPDAFREVVVLVDVEELTYEEAAAALDCPVGTVRSRLFRGRRLLHSSLSDYACKRGLLRGSGG